MLVTRPNELRKLRSRHRHRRDRLRSLLRPLQRLPQRHQERRGFLGWTEIVFVIVGAVMVALLARHGKRSVALISGYWHSRGQFLYAELLWTMFAISTIHEAAMFEPVSLVMQGLVAATGAACMWFALAGSGTDAALVQPWPRRMAALGVIAVLLSAFGGWAVKRALYGDSFAGYFYMDHIRFGPNHTNDKR